MAAKTLLKKKVEAPVAKVEKSEPVTKADLIDMLSDESEYMKATVKDITNAVFGKISEVLQSGREVQIHAFGSFLIRDTEARIGRNPSTGEQIEIPAGKRISFKFSSAVKKAFKEEN